MSARTGSLVLLALAALGRPAGARKPGADLAQPAAARRVLEASQFLLASGAEDCADIARHQKKRTLGAVARALRPLANRGADVSCAPATDGGDGWSCKAVFSSVSKAPGYADPDEATWSFRYQVRDDVVQSLTCFYAG